MSIVALMPVPGYLANLDVISAHGQEVIGFSNAVFSWTKEHEQDLQYKKNNGTTSPTPTHQPKRKQRQFKLRVDGTLLFQRGGVNLVVGPTYVRFIHHLLSFKVT